MISVSHAHEIIFKQVRINSAEVLPLAKAYGRILREDIVNDRDQPPFDKSTMDGIAIRASDCQNAQSVFKILGTIAAGNRPPQKKWIKQSCYKIMTGAPLPEGYDAVIPIEYVAIKSNMVSIKGLSSVTSGMNIRWKAGDSKRGSVLVKAGEILKPVHMACAASTGKHALKVSSLPKIAIISTGNELVPIHRKNILPYQTRLSNAYAIASAVEQGPWSRTQCFHLKDNPELLYKKLKAILSNFDVLVLSGGVSKGDFDYVPDTLKRLGVECLFHGVSQKPGKPLWFGKHSKGTVVFALPGNPVSTLICVYRYVLPYLKECAGVSMPVTFVQTESILQNDSQLTRFFPVEIIFSKTNEQLARVVASGGSGDFASLSLCDGFVEISSEGLKKSKKVLVPFYRW